MQYLNWLQVGNTYTALLPYGRAVITEHRDTSENHPVGGALSYTAHIEDIGGTILEAFWDSFRTFEMAEEWVLAKLIELDQPDNDPAGRDRLLKTLALCQSLFPTNTHPTHHARIERTKRWLLGQFREDDDLVSKPPVDQIVYRLEWIEVEDGYHAATPHGTAIITEIRDPIKQRYIIGGASSYTARIEHASGASVDGPGTFIDFTGAEAWMRTKLAELDDPRIAEVYIENIRFTLTICQKVLPADAVPIHLERLNYLKERIAEYLI